MKKRGIALRILWWAYLTLLLALVVVKFRGSFAELGDKMASTSVGANVNLVPFRTIGAQISQLSHGWARFNLLGNVIPFAPFGFLLPLVHPGTRSFARVMTVGVFLVLLIELFQLLTRLGSFDVDDILLNLLGIALGYCALRLAAARRGSPHASKQ